MSKIGIWSGQFLHYVLCNFSYIINWCRNEMRCAQIKSAPLEGKGIHEMVPMPLVTYLFETLFLDRLLSAK